MLDYKEISRFAEKELLSGKNFIFQIPRTREKLFFTYYPAGIYKRPFLIITSSKKGSVLWRGQRLDVIRLFSLGFYETAIMHLLILTNYLKKQIFSKKPEKRKLLCQRHEDQI